MERFTYATLLDLNMGYYTIRLDPDAQKICTIILPWGKYSFSSTDGNRRFTGYFRGKDVQSDGIVGILARIFGRFIDHNQQ